MIVLVAAMDANHLIGCHHQLPWHNPADLAHFRTLTLHHHILLGRTTYEHLPKPLDERILHVASRHPLRDPEVVSCRDMEALLKEWNKKTEILYVCGGASIYQAALPYAQEMWITWIDGVYKGDTWFPHVDFHAFRIVSIEQKEGCKVYHYRKR